MNSFKKNSSRAGTGNQTRSPAGRTGPGSGAKRLELLKRLLIAVCFVVAAVLLFPAHGIPPESEFREGSVSDEEIIAPFEFSVLKPEKEYEEEKARAAQAVLPIFTVDEEETGREMARLATLRQSLEAQKSGQTAPLDLTSLGDIRLSTETEQLLARPALGMGVLKEVESFGGEVLALGVVKSKRIPEIAGHDRVKMVKAGKETEIPVQRLLDENSVHARALAHARERFARNPAAAAAFVELADALIDANTRYDAERTNIERANAQNAVSRFDGIVLQGEKIIGSHERITAEHLKKLRSLEFYRQGLARGIQGLKPSVPSGSRALIAALFLFVFVWYLRVRHPAILSDTKMLLLLALVSLFVIGLASLVLHVLKLSAFLIPVAIASLLITLLLDDEIALILSIITTVLIGVLARLDLMFIVVSLVAGITAVFAVIGVRHRRQFYKAMLLVALAYVVTVAAGGITASLPGQQVVRGAAFGALNSFVSILVVMAVLPFMESAFGLTTNITLLELSDLNRPILRRMMIEAPGTYHHSMVVGSLAEAAAEAIGANSLLARVASYYHDIGKITKPEYYIENQKDARSRHDRLSPSMSCLILESHVREGVEMAKQEKLPEAIRRLIMEHHGTTLMAFFYQKALEIDSDAPIDEYRYPGPKPSSKEAAIVMLADSVEAASRSLSAPTPSRIHGIVKRIIENRATEGELDECGLTMAELARIRNSFVPILTSIFHGRPPYPDDVKKKENGDIGSEQAEKDRYQ